MYDALPMPMVSTKVMHPCVRQNNNAIVTVIGLICLLTSRCTANVMGEQCDWTGNGLSGTSNNGGVTPVYLRCTQGTIRWSFPQGALRVLLRLPSANRDFRGCIKVKDNFNGARIFIEGTRSLSPLFAIGDGGHSQLVRCFVSKHGQAALYVEATNTGAAGLRKQIAEFSYDLQAVPKGSSVNDVINAECRPCTDPELALSYCTSDLVARGTIHSVDDLVQVEQARINVRLRRTLRQSTTDVTTEMDKEVSYILPRHCEPQHGPGEFVFMGRKRLGDLTLTCVISLSQWAALATRMNNDGSAHCLLNT